MKLYALAFGALFTFVEPSAVYAADQPVATTARLLDSMAIVARPMAATVGVVLSQLQYIGVRRIRVQGQEAPVLKPFCAAGVKLNMLQDPSPVLSVAKALGRSCIEAVEGFNEINANTDRFRFGALGGLPAALAAQATLFAAVQAWDPTLPVLTPSQSVGSAPIGGDMRAMANRGNAHVYLSAGVPIGFGPGLPTQVANSAGRNAPGLPFWITETGYPTFTNGVSEADQAIRAVQVFLDGLSAGAEVTTWYQLQDTCADGNDPECRYGLYRQDGSPKPAAVALHNFTTVMGYPADAPAVSNPKPLTLGWDGLPYDAHVAQFVAGNGAYRIAVWRENRTDQTWPDVQATLTLPGTAYVQVYDPVTGTARIQPAVIGSKVAVTLGMRPLIIQAEGLE